MNSIDQHATGLRRAIWIGFLLFLIAAPAQANRIIQVRVGNHPTFTRLVFELDSSTGYQVQRRAGTDGAEQLTVTLEASTRAREISSKSVGIESVRIDEATDRAVAQIQLRKSGLQMKEMILSNPPRIVLDFVHSAAAVAELTGDPYSKPAPKPVVKKVAKPKPAPKPVVEKVAKPKPAPKPVVEKVAKPKPAPKPVDKTVAES
jgi:N-acetylmuramoyl-L-alanine amidase